MRSVECSMQDPFTRHTPVICIDFAQSKIACQRLERQANVARGMAERRELAHMLHLAAYCELVVRIAAEAPSCLMKESRESSQSMPCVWR